MAKVKDSGSTKGEDQAAEPKTGAAKSPKRIKLFGSLAAVVVTASAAGGYFAFETFAASRAESEHVAAAPVVPSGPLPVAVAGSLTRKAADYQIISVFDGEAILATEDTLVRVKAGSLAPGLGTITSIEASPSGGGSVVGTKATLRAL